MKPIKQNKKFYSAVLPHNPPVIAKSTNFVVITAYCLNTGAVYLTKRQLRKLKPIWNKASIEPVTIYLDNPFEEVS